ncbi:hypothetical protein [Cellvibrio mixtus]|uniref:hypothetical protein n=1 Tax=Cellvibrio mixtus TaxID=39650 RepID=UPI000586A865|nr:hypothetical protein [Cellvibrio mixtus]
MVYLGPITPRPQPVKNPARPTSITPVRAYASDQHGIDVDAAPAIGVGPPGGVERRKQDRRSKSGEHLVETRAGKDRRKSPKPSINISI